MENSLTNKKNISQKDKIKALKKNGDLCFEYNFENTDNILDFKKSQAKCVAGRVTELNKLDLTGKISDYSDELEFKLVRNKSIQEKIKYLDEGDIVGLYGEILDEKIFICKNIKVLTKTLLPLSLFRLKKNPKKWQHLLYILDRNNQKTILLRAKTISFLRNYLSKKQFIEIDTPLLHPYQGDSIALPLFVDASASKTIFSLASSPELYLKKMLVGGFNKVFTINKAFRNEQIDNTHLIEFLSVEYYMAYVDYLFMMNFTEKLFKSMVKEILGIKQIVFKGYKLDFSKKFKKISIHKVLINKFKKDLFKCSYQELLDCAKILGISYQKTISPGNIIIDIFNKLIGNNLIQPTFVFDFPKDASVMCYDITMAKEKRSNPDILERFELYIGGMEIANCYSELNESEKQKDSFNLFLKDKSRKLKLDPNFYHALQIGLPPSSGIGFGIDRVVMLLANQEKIYNTIPFSTYHESK